MLHSYSMWDLVEGIFQVLPKKLQEISLGGAKCEQNNMGTHSDLEEHTVSFSLNICHFLEPAPTHLCALRPAAVSWVVPLGLSPQSDTSPPLLPPTSLWAGLTCSWGKTTLIIQGLVIVTTATSCKQTHSDWHTFMQRPIHLSFGWVKTIVDG